MPGDLAEQAQDKQRLQSSPCQTGHIYHPCCMPVAAETIQKKKRKGDWAGDCLAHGRRSFLMFLIYDRSLQAALSPAAPPWSVASLQNPGANSPGQQTPPQNKKATAAASSKQTLQVSARKCASDSTTANRLSTRHTARRVPTYTPSPHPPGRPLSNKSCASLLHGPPPLTELNPGNRMVFLGRSLAAAAPAAASSRDGGITAAGRAIIPTATGSAGGRTDWGAWPAASDLSAALRPRVAGLASLGRCCCCCCWAGSAAATETVAAADTAAVSASSSGGGGLSVTPLPISRPSLIS